MFADHCGPSNTILILAQRLLQTTNPLNPTGRYGAKNPTGRYTGICYGVSKTRRECKPAHVRSIINCFLYTGRYQATIGHKLKVQACLVLAYHAIYYTVFVLDARFCVENMAEIFSVCEGTNTHDVMDNVEELYNQKIGF